ncbi:MAG: hypothetical protein ACI87E_001839 [Mariniblastus sp.]|jgi:hypothetical protein
MIRSLTLLSLAWLASWVPMTQTQDEPTAQSVIADYVTAKGGRGCLEATKNCSLRGKVTSAGKALGSFESFHAADKHLSIETFPDGRERRHGTNGKIAWQIDLEGTPRILRGQEAKDYIRHYGTFNATLEWDKHFKAIQYIGESSVNATKVHHLSFVNSDDSRIDRYFSQASGFLIREKQSVVLGDITDMLVSDIGDYTQADDGSWVPRSRINQFGKRDKIEFNISSVESNRILDDSFFNIPKSVLRLQQSSNRKTD